MSGQFANVERETPNKRNKRYRKILFYTFTFTVNYSHFSNLFLDQTIHNLCQRCGSSTLTRDYSAILYVTHFFGTQEYIKFDIVHL